MRARGGADAERSSAVLVRKCLFLRPTWDVLMLIVGPMSPHALASGSSSSVQTPPLPRNLTPLT